MAFVRICPAAFLPQIFRKPGTVIVAFTVRHQCGQISREVLGVSIILTENVFEVFLGKQASPAGPNESAIPYGMFCLKTH